MANGRIDVDERPIGELFGQLIDDGKGFARAELGLLKAQAEAKADALKLPLILFGVAFLFLLAGVVVLCMTIAMALATLIGPLAGGLVATLIALGIAGGLAFLGKKKLGEGK